MNESDLNYVDYPYLISMFIVAIFSNFLAVLWATMEERATEKLNNPLSKLPNPLLISLQMIPVLALGIFMFNLLPAIMLTFVAKASYIEADILDNISTMEILYPASRIALLASLTGCFALITSTQAKKNMAAGMHYLKALLFIFPAYCGTMSLSWYLTYQTTLTDWFDSSIQKINLLYYIPSAFYKTSHNITLMVLLFLLAPLVSWIIRKFLIGPSGEGVTEGKKESAREL